MEVREFREINRIPRTFDGAPIDVRFLAELTAHRGKLLSARPEGTPVLAGSFLRKREIVLDSELAGEERSRVLVHELFHFVWLRLGNPARASWTDVLNAEREARARGELGWSSEWRKRDLRRVPWRDYVCESFCDTAAWMYAGLERHEEFTLAARWRVKRRKWFEANLPARARV